VARTTTRKAAHPDTAAMEAGATRAPTTSQAGATEAADLKAGTAPRKTIFSLATVKEVPSNPAHPLPPLPPPVTGTSNVTLTISTTLSRDLATTSSRGRTRDHVREAIKVRVPSRKDQATVAISASRRLIDLRRTPEAPVPVATMAARDPSTTVDRHRGASAASQRPARRQWCLRR